MAVEEMGGNEHWDLSITRKPFFLYPGGNHPIKNWGRRVNLLYHPDAQASLGSLGERAGYKFDFDAPLSDTMDSHRLVLWAQQQRAAAGEELAHAAGIRYFTKGQPLADRNMLCEAAAEVGLDAEKARAYLESEAGYEEVISSVESNRASGVHSIPVFVFKSEPIQFQETVHGSASVSQFAKVLEAIQARWRTIKGS